MRFHILKTVKGQKRTSWFSCAQNSPTIDGWYELACTPELRGINAGREKWHGKFSDGCWGINDEGEHMSGVLNNPEGFKWRGLSAPIKEPA